MFRPSALAAALACAFSAAPSINHALAQGRDTTIPTVEVNGTRQRFDELGAPYANEVYTRADIEASGASSLVEFLSRASLVSVSSAFGNNLAPNLDIRGFGIEQGTRAVGIVVNGRPITSIDSANTFLTQIPLSSIQSIEVLRGYGAAAHGNGAIAGTIVITTKVQDGAEIRAGMGSNRLREGGFSVAQTFGIAQLSAAVDTIGSDGSGTAPDGRTDGSFSRVQQAGIGIAVTPKLNVNLSAKAVDTQVNYPNPISVQQFKENPRVLNNSGFFGPITSQRFELDEYNADLTLRVNERHTVSLLGAVRESSSAFGTGFPALTAEFLTDLQSTQRLSGLGGTIQLAVGATLRHAERESAPSSGKKTSSNLSALFATGSLRRAAWTYAAGLRGEQVTFKTNENAAPDAPLKDDEQYLNIDGSVSVAHSPTASTYVAVSRGVQAPNIDYFFRFDPSFTFQQFNGFIAPARAINLTLGHNTRLGDHALKGSVFYTRLRNEIYTTPDFQNTNIDRSHKVGLELQDQWKAARNLDVNLAASYVRSVIDDEAGIADGDLPGVPKLNLKAGLSWAFAPQFALDASTTFKSGALRFGDFANTGVNRQIPERSTDLQLRYFERNYVLAVGVNNLLDQQNGLNAGTDSIYPTLTERTFFVRGSVKF